MAIYLTVGLSVLAHGLTAAPLAGRYARWYEQHPPSGAADGERPGRGHATARSGGRRRAQTPQRVLIGEDRRHGTASIARGPGRIGRLAPISDWLPRYDRGALRGDVLAGIAVAAMIVPKDLGYAGIAGIPVQNGLYAAAAGAIVYALFCTSRHISTGPSSSLAAVAGGAVLAAGVEGAQAAELVAAITLVTGALFLLLAVLRLGWVARFLSRAVVTGFLAGAAVDVVIGELPKLTGTSASGETAWGELASWIRSLGEVSGTTVLVGRRGAGGHPRPALLGPARAGRARARRRRADRDAAVQPRRARRRARRHRAPRPAHAGPAGPRRLPRPLRRRSSRPRPACS